jgi:hypothetical protein
LIGSTVDTVVSSVVHARAEEVADLGLGDAGDAGDRRSDAGETEVEPGRLERCLGGFKRGFGREVGAGGVIEILLADGVHRRQGLDAGQVRPRRFITRRLLGTQSLRLFDGSLESARVDLEERLSLLHQLSFAVVLPDQVAGDLRTDDGIDVAVERADPFQVDRYVPLRDGDESRRPAPLAAPPFPSRRPR